MSDDKSSDFEKEKWRYEQNRSIAERAHDHQKEFGNKANAAAVSSGANAVRALLVINGGAAVAVLAFIAQVAGLDGAKYSNKLSELTAPLAWFAWGVALAAFGTGAAYFTNYCIGAASFRMQRHYEHPYLRPTASSKRWRIAAIVFQVLAVLAGVGSLVMFLFGMNEIRAVIGTLR
jgi:hypothetical protein